MSKADETATFSYNADGLRVKKVCTTGTTHYTLHGKNLVHLSNGSNNLHFFYDAQNRPAVVVFNGTAYGYVHNLQGDIIAIVNSGGTKVVEYTYDPWGKPLSKTGTLASTLGTLNPFRYRGYIYDEESWFYYLNSRYYSPNRNRFINGDDGIDHNRRLVAANVFDYSINSPVLYCDADGKEAGVILLGEEFFPTDIFSESILPKIMSYLNHPDDYYYHNTGYRLAVYNDDGSCKKQGYSDCSHLMYELCNQAGSFTAKYRYGGYRGPKGAIVVEGSHYGEFTTDLIEGMEVYTKNKTHVGMLMLFDFGDGLEWAVFQSASESVDDSKALFQGDTGPNITSLNKKDGTSQWVWFTYPQLINDKDLIE